MGRGRGKKETKKQEQNRLEEEFNAQMYAEVREANALADAKNDQEEEDEFAAANDSEEERENDGSAVIDIGGSGEVKMEELVDPKERAIAAAKARINEVIASDAADARGELSPKVLERSTLSWAHSRCFLERFADKGHPRYVMYSNLV